MSPEEKAALIMSQAAKALITAMGMFVQDMHQIKHFGGAGIYTESAYENVILENNIHWNAVITTLRG